VRADRPNRPAGRHPLLAEQDTIGGPVISRPRQGNAFEFVILASLRTAQLMRGCTPRVTASEKPAVTAQREVAAGKIVQQPAGTDPS
jgi:DNA-directed RNA polymerase subunit K/omega